MGSGSASATPDGRLSHVPETLKVFVSMDKDSPAATARQVVQLRIDRVTCVHDVYNRALLLRAPPPWVTEVPTENQDVRPTPRRTSFGGSANKCWLLPPAPKIGSLATMSTVTSSINDTTTILDPGTIATVASIIAGFGVAMLFFRIQRELDMREQDETIWIPWADRLLIGATLISLILALLPVVAFHKLPFFLAISSAACAGSVVLVAGYVLAILAHYRLFLGRSRTGRRENPEPAERGVVYSSIALALLASLWTLAST